ncbi:MAG TPA: hypothetical protein PKK40_09535 [Marmoricola sp.]|nr:hypothetical protein [Marmoricola sp.]
MSILWWLVPSVLCTLGAIAWVTWVSRAPQAESEDEVLAKIGAALAAGPKRLGGRTDPPPPTL